MENVAKNISGGKNGASQNGVAHPRNCGNAINIFEDFIATEYFLGNLRNQTLPNEARVAGNAMFGYFNPDGVGDFLNNFDAQFFGLSVKMALTKGCPYSQPTLVAVSSIIAANCIDIICNNATPEETARIMSELNNLVQRNQRPAQNNFYNNGSRQESQSTLLTDRTAKKLGV